MSCMESTHAAVTLETKSQPRNNGLDPWYHASTSRRSPAVFRWKRTLHHRCTQSMAQQLPWEYWKNLAAESELPYQQELLHNADRWWIRDHQKD